MIGFLWWDILLLVIFIMFLVLRTFYIYKIFKHLEKNYPKIFYKYNPNNLSYWVSLIYEAAFYRMGLDILFSKNLNLDKNLDRHVLITRTLSVGMLIVSVILIYLLYFS